MINLMTPIDGKESLVDYFQRGCKAPGSFAIGSEHELFLFDGTTHRRLPFKDPSGVGPDVEGLLKAYGHLRGWKPLTEGGNVVALASDVDAATITLEPGGQLELSGAPHPSLHAIFAETAAHFSALRTLQTRLNFKTVSVGYDPVTPLDTTGKADYWVPKERYDIMRRYHTPPGDDGVTDLSHAPLTHAMMTHTIGIQTNSDYASEDDMVKKIRVALSLQPIVTALFANSPFSLGHMNGYQSYRAHVWQHTDPQRCGPLPWVFEEGMGFERYVDYLLDVPMYIAVVPKTASSPASTMDTYPARDPQFDYIPAQGQSFRDFLAGRLPAAPGHRPTMAAWIYHSTCAFPDVRLKQCLEMRGADGAPEPFVTALSALWAGLLYDTSNLDTLYDRIQTWTPADRAYLHGNVPLWGLDAPFKDTTLRAMAKSMITMAMEGLQRRKLLNEAGEDESIYLAPLVDLMTSGFSQASLVSTMFLGPWKGDMAPLFA